MKPQTDQRDPGPQSLLCAICHQALVDYWILYRMGAVRWCKATGQWQRRQDGGQVYMGMSMGDCRDLLTFIQQHAGRVLALCGIEVEPGHVRRRMIALERSGEWRRYFGQGCKDHIASGAPASSMQSMTTGAST
jgi:hypothetical protein